jgi:hypothetical protein
MRATQVSAAEMRGLCRGSCGRRSWNRCCLGQILWPRIDSMACISIRGEIREIRDLHDRTTFPLGRHCIRLRQARKSAGRTFGGGTCAGGQTRAGRTFAAVARPGIQAGGSASRASSQARSTRARANDDALDANPHHNDSDSCDAITRGSAKPRRWWEWRPRPNFRRALQCQFRQRASFHVKRRLRPSPFRIRRLQLRIRRAVASGLGL